MDTARARLLERYAMRKRAREALASRQERRDTIATKLRERREHVRTTARDRALRLGLDAEAAELAGRRALEEMDLAARDRRRARRSEVPRHASALPQIEAQEMWLDRRRPLRERIFAALLVRHPTGSTGKMLQEATSIAAQLRGARPAQNRERLRRYVARQADHILAPLPATPSVEFSLLREDHPRPGIRAAIGRAFSRIWSQRAAPAATAR